MEFDWKKLVLKVLAKKPDDSYGPLTINSKGELQVNTADDIDGMRDDWFRSVTEFNELRVVNREQQFSINSNFPLSKIRDNWSGDVEHIKDEYRIGPGGTLETADIITYIPGFPVEVGTGIRLDNIDANLEAQWGAFDDDDGFYWQRLPDGTYEVGIRTSDDTNDDRTISQQNWSIDSMDGTGPSGIDITQGNKGYIFHIVYSYYGYGPVMWLIMDTSHGESVRDNHLWVAHIEGDWTESTSIANANLPIRVKNIGTGGDIYVAGRQVNTIGKFEPKGRPTSVITDIKNIGDTWTPIASIDRKPNFTNSQAFTINIENYTVNNTGADKILTCVVLADSLTDATWNLLPELRSAGETAIRFDQDATDVSGAEAISPVHTTDGGKSANKTGISSEDFFEQIPIPRGRKAVIMGRTTVAQATTDIDIVLTVKEKW